MDKKVTMKDIAERLNVSINTVSLVLNDKVGVGENMRLSVLRIAEELGYLEHNERYNKAYSSKNICLLVRKAYFHDGYFYSKVLYGIQNEAIRLGYDVIIHISDEQEEIPACIEKRKVAGIIVLGEMQHEKIKELIPYNLPMLFVDSAPRGIPSDSILTDNRLGSGIAVEYLINMGYKNIGFFGDLYYSLSVKERFWGYVDSISTLDFLHTGEDALKYASRFSILQDIEHAVLKQDTDHIAKLLKQREQLPQAFMCSNDRAAVLLSNSLRLLGYEIPRNMSIIGFDDMDLAKMVMPKLTTLHVSTRKMGEKAARQLVWRINNKKQPQEKILMPVELVVRDSVISADSLGKINHIKGE